MSGSESYRLTIRPPDQHTSNFFTIEATSETGRRHGLRTLAQLIQQYRNKIPCLIIEDEPSFPMRGIMLDISRDRVPRMDELFRMIDLLASWKINHLQLYTEHTFAYQGHEVVWKDASPLTPEEVRELDQYCLRRGITLAANQNCFGHMERWLKHDKYSHLAETTGDWNFMGISRKGGFSLCPIDAGSISLVRDLLGQLLPNFTSGLVNIGCDETFDVGQGRSRAKVAKSGYAAVYADYVRQVIETARRLEFRSMFWADMALKSPEALSLIPKDAITLVWGYEADTPFGNWCNALQRSGFEYWVCPGTSSWRSITGRTYERKANLTAAAKQGLSAGAKGFMVTDWGDLGHRQQFPVSLHAFAEAANAAWNAESADRFDPLASSLFAFGDETGSTGKWLDELGNVDLELRRKNGILNATCLFKDLHTPLAEIKRYQGIGTWEGIKERIDDLEKRIPSGVNHHISRELRHTLDIAKFAADRAIAIRKVNRSARGTSKNLIKQLNNVIEEHRELWLLRSRPGGLDDSVQYYRGVLIDLKQSWKTQ